MLDLLAKLEEAQETHHKLQAKAVAMQVEIDTALADPRRKGRASDSGHGDRKHSPDIRQQGA